MQNLGRMLWCGFLEARCNWGCSQRSLASYVTCGKWCLEISEMDLNHCLGPPPTQAQAAGWPDQIKIIGPIKFLLEVFALGDSYRVIISPVNGQIILIVVYIDCIQHPVIISRSWCTSGSIKQISFTNHQMGTLNLYKWHHIDCSFVFFVLSCVGTIVHDHASSPLEQLLARFDVGHWVQSVILDWEFIIQ